MATKKAVITQSHLTDIANAIIAKGGATGPLKPSEMKAAIEAIPSGGGGFDWAKPDDWPAFDLLDPRTGSKEYSVFVLCDSTIGIEPFLSFNGCRRLEKLNLSSDGAWSVAETIPSAENKVCVWLDKSQKYSVWRAVGKVSFGTSIIDADHPDVYPSVRNAVCGEIVYGVNDFTYSVYGAMSPISTNYYINLLYLKLVDVHAQAFGGNGWRQHNSIRCVEYDGFTTDAQTFGRSFEGSPTIQVVKHKNVLHNMANNGSFLGHYSGSKILSYDFSVVNPLQVEDFQYLCQDWTLIKSIDLTQFVHWGKNEDGSPNVVGLGGGIKKFGSSFTGCRNLTDLNISCLDLSGVTSAGSCFNNCWAMQNLTMPPPERNLRVSFDIHFFTLMSRENIVKILNSLADISGETAQTLTMGAVMLGKLTDEEKSIATNKGWTLA